MGKDGVCQLIVHEVEEEHANRLQRLVVQEDLRMFRFPQVHLKIQLLEFKMSSIRITKLRFDKILIKFDDITRIS